MRRNKGISLAEVLITAALLGIIIIPLSTMMAYGYRSFSDKNDSAMAMRYARQAIDIVMADLRKNWDSAATTAGITLTVKSVEYPTISYSLVTAAGRGQILKTTINSAADAPVSKSIFEGMKDEEKINITGFDLAERPSGNDNLIDITIRLRYGKSLEHTVKDTFRKKQLD